MLSVSIIIPTLNEERYLPGLLDSLLASVGVKMEIVVVDGRSEDKTVEVVRAYGERAAEYVSLKSVTSQKRNIALQRNMGVRHTTRDLLVFLDADTALPSVRTLADVCEAFVRGKHAAASCRFIPLERDIRARLFYAVLYAFQKFMERWNPYATGACLVTRRDVFEACEGFDASLTMNEDANFCLRASRFGTFRILPQVIRLSARRFRSYGYLSSGLLYVSFFIHRTVCGERRHPLPEYPFGTYD